MKRPLLISIIVHVFILTLLIFMNSPATSHSGPTVQSVSIRIRNSFSPTPPKSRVKSVRKSPTRSLPPSSDKTTPVIVSAVVRKTPKIPEIDNFSERSAGISRVPVEHKRIFQNADSGVKFKLPERDALLSPFAGMEENLLVPENLEKKNDTQYSLFWIDGVGREVLSYPDFNDNPFPESTDRLVDVPVRIEVSPQGYVSAVTIEPPGTGDVKIDRYVTNKILEIVFEPRFSDMKEESGVIKLIFRGGEE